MTFSPTHLISEGAETIIVKSWRKEVQETYRFKDAFEEAGLLQEFVGVLDRINSTLAVAERYRPPSVIARTLVSDGLRMLELRQGVPRVCWQGDGLRLGGATKPTLRSPRR